MDKPLDEALEKLNQFLPLSPLEEKKTKEDKSLFFVSHFKVCDNPQKKKFISDLQELMKNSKLNFKLLDPFMISSQLGYQAIPRRKKPLTPQVSSSDLKEKLPPKFEWTPELIDAAHILKEVEKIALPLARLNIKGFYFFIERFLDEKKPALLLLWCQFFWWNRVIRYFCDKRKIPYFFVEYGALPNTIGVDEDGQMAESSFFKKACQLNSLPVNPEDIEKAKNYLSKILKEKISRKENEPSSSNKNSISLKTSSEKKVIVYFGQNDPCTGMVPDFSDKAQLHSPVFKSTLEALLALEKTLDPQIYDLYFKPHPSLYDRTQTLLEKQPLQHFKLISKDMNIYDCLSSTDLAITILSNVAYQALSLKVPVLQLGRNTLTHASFVDTILSPEVDISSKVKKILNRGFTSKIEKEWNIFCATLLKYHLICNDDSLSSFVKRKTPHFFSLLEKRAQI